MSTGVSARTAPTPTARNTRPKTVNHRRAQQETSDIGMSSNEEERVAAPRERQPKMPVIRLFVATVPFLQKFLIYFGRDRKSMTPMEILIAP